MLVHSISTSAGGKAEDRRPMLYGVTVPMLFPYDEKGNLIHDAVARQSVFFSGIKQVAGVALFTSIKDKKDLEADEQFEILGNVKASLGQSKFILFGLDPGRADRYEIVERAKALGANAILITPRSSLKSVEPDEPCRLKDVTVDACNEFCLPIVFAHLPTKSGKDDLPNMLTLVNECENIIGADLNQGDCVYYYDRDFYQLKSVPRPVAALSSGVSALFHNLNTGCDSTLSWLSFVAPHEVCRLFSAYREGGFF